MHLPMKPQNRYSSNLSKIAVISLSISAVFICDFEQVFMCKEKSYAKADKLYKW